MYFPLAGHLRIIVDFEVLEGPIDALHLESLCLVVLACVSWTLLVLHHWAQIQSM